MCDNCGFDEISPIDAVVWNTNVQVCRSECLHALEQTWKPFTFSDNVRRVLRKYFGIRLV